MFQWYHNHKQHSRLRQSKPFENYVFFSQVEFMLLKRWKTNPNGEEMKMQY